MEDLKLSELREQFPHISANSKKSFLKKLEAELEAAVEMEVVEPEVVEAPLDIVDYLFSKAKTKEKILIKAENASEADNIFAILQFELFPKVEEDGMTVVASSVRRDMSLNGTCYCRVTCAKNYELHKGLQKYTTLKEV